MHQGLAHTFSRQSRRAAARKAAPMLGCARVSVRPCIRAITTVDAFGNALGNGVAEQASAPQRDLGSGLKPTQEIAESLGNRDVPSAASNSNENESSAGAEWSSAQRAALEFALRNPVNLMTDDAMPMTQAQRYAQTFGGEAIEVANKRSPSLSELQDNADRLYAQRWASDKTPIPYPQYGWDIRKHLIAGNALQEQFANKTAPSDQVIAETLSGLQQKQQELDQQLMRQGSGAKSAELVLAINSLRRASQDVVAALIDSGHPMGRDAGANQLVAMAAQYAANGVSGVPGLGLRGFAVARTGMSQSPRIETDSSFTKTELGMFRRTENVGRFSDLPVTMDLRTVRGYANEAGVGLDGVKVRIIRDESLIGKDLYGYAHPNGRFIDLYPDAFSSPEALVRTLGHERMHIYQARTFGPPKDVLDLRLNEKAAYGLEDSFVQYWRNNGKR